MEYDMFLPDEELISLYLNPMVVNGESFPDNYFKKVEDVFNINPYLDFTSYMPALVIVKPRTEDCGKTDGCESGCWRIMAREKLIKSTNDGKILGFKKILKFCLKRKPREYKRIYVMEEFRLTNNLNWKQDHVICKIRLLFLEEIRSLLAIHFNTTSGSLLEYEVLPDYGFGLLGPDQEDEDYLSAIKDSGGENEWPSFVTNEVYCLNPLMLVDPQDQTFRNNGICIFSDKTLDTRSCKCDGGNWRILHRDKLIKSNAGETLGFKKVFKFYEQQSDARKEDDVKEKVTWTISEYRLKETVKKKKLLCVIKLAT